MNPDKLLTTTPSAPSTAPTIILTDEQTQAIILINDWFYHSPSPSFKLGGYAGTGKTTIIRSLLNTFAKDQRVIVAAFTGKACNVLQRKNIPAQTIHSLIYHCENTKTGWVFTRRSSLEGKPTLIIIDEASMLSTELYTDLISYHIKLLFVGDPGQLEPVGDNPNLMQTPDFILNKIHRQAEASPIITLASDVRLGVGACLIPRQSGNDLIVRTKKVGFTPEELLCYSQCLCARNKTRSTFNEKVRLFKNYVKPLVVGEKLIVLRNNLSFNVFNGMILFVDSIDEDRAEHWKTACHDEVGGKHRLDIWKPPFESEAPIKSTDYIPRKYVYCDYAYAITCHKAQGSEWDKVVVFDEWMPPTVWDMKRWRYTAITRAAKNLLYLV